MPEWTRKLADVKVTTLIWVAPVLFVLHVIEEQVFGFVPWANGILVDSITQQQFLLVNTSGFVIFALIALAVGSSRNGASVLLAVCWLSFTMFANPFVHLGATLIVGTYSPGVVTSTALNLPYFFWFVAVVARTSTLRTSAIVTATLVGALPMLVHGYLIVFQGTTLFRL